MLKKIQKKFPIIYEHDSNVRLDETKSFAYCKTKDFLLKRNDWEHKDRRETTLEEIQKAVKIAQRLRLYCFFLPDVCYDPDIFETILKIIPVENISKITVGKKLIMVIETDFGFFAIAPRIETKTYEQYQELLKEKKKFFGKTCIECEHPATVYDSYTSTFSCQAHAPEETVHSEVYLEYLEVHNF